MKKIILCALLILGLALPSAYAKTWDDGGAWTARSSTSGAPTNATYITQTSNGSLSAEQALASLSTGIMRVATTTGVVTALTDSAGIAANISDETGTGLLVFATTPTFTTSATVDGVIYILEQADASADSAGYGQIWVNTATPNELWFTDDTGTDVQLGVGGAGGATAYDDIGDPDANSSIDFGGFTNTWNVGADIASGDFFTITGAAAGELAASSGTQSLVSFTPHINQSGTAAYTAFEVDVTETSTGSGAKNLLDLQVGGVSKFSISNTGDLIVGDGTDSGVVQIRGVSVPYIALLEGASTFNMIFRADWTKDQTVIETYAGGGRQLILAGVAATNDFDHAVGTDPVFYVQSVTNPNTDNTEFVSTWHNQTDGNIDSGKGTLNLGATGNVNFAGATRTASTVTHDAYVTLEIGGVAYKFMLGS